MQKCAELNNVVTTIIARTALKSVKRGGDETFKNKKVDISANLYI
jgi:hypothetical protein